MKIGMLWFDSDPKITLADKVEHAAEYYRTKYGNIPTVCFVHPSMLPVDENGNSSERENAPEGNPLMVACGIEVRSHPAVRPNHFWIGVNGVK